jgi:hypothetical protein
VGPRAGLDAEDRRKILCPRTGSNPKNVVVVSERKRPLTSSGRRWKNNFEMNLKIRGGYVDWIYLVQNMIKSCSIKDGYFLDKLSDC